MLWYAVIIGSVLVSIYIWLKRKLHGLPLIAGLWLIILASFYVSSVYPPSPERILLFAFVLGFGIALIIWGIVNYYISKYCIKAITKSFGEDGMLELQIKGHYGILYGFFIHTDVAVAAFRDFINEEIWFKGWKISGWNLALSSKASQPCWYVMCLLEPKTILDRILK